MRKRKKLKKKEDGSLKGFFNPDHLTISITKVIFYNTQYSIMKTAIITVKTNPLIKSRAQKMAKDLGLAFKFFSKRFS